MGANKHESTSMTVRAAWLLGARLLAFMFAFALPLLLVRRLSQHDFGTYKQLFLVVGTAITTLPLGFGMSAFYFLPRERERRSQIVLNIVLFQAVIGALACVSLFLYPQLLPLIFRSTELAQYAPVIGLIILLWIVGAFLEVVVIANQEPKLATILIVISQFSKALLLFIAAILFGSIWALVYAALVQGVLQNAILMLYLRSRFGSFWRRFNWSVMRVQLSYALPLGMASLLFRVHSDLHNYFVSYRFGAAGYAIYAVGCFNFLLVDMLSEAVGSVMIPQVSYLQSIGQQREIIELTARMIRKLAAIFAVLYVFLLIMGREVITVLFTARYLNSWPVFAFNLTMIPLTLIATATDPILRAYAEHRYFLLKVRTLLLPVLFGSLYLLTLRFGLVGAIAAVVGVTMIERVATAFKSATIVGARLRDLVLLKDTAKLLLAAIGSGLLTQFLRMSLTSFRPIVILSCCALFFTFTYLFAIFLLRIPSVDERRVLQDRFNSLWYLLWKKTPVHLPEG
jgi:O-antigen/teichoic acid export membrane protein